MAITKTVASGLVVIKNREKKLSLGLKKLEFVHYF